MAMDVYDDEPDVRVTDVTPRDLTTQSPTVLLALHVNVPSHFIIELIPQDSEIKCILQYDLNTNFK
jgi:hypothetical protein